MDETGPAPYLSVKSRKRVQVAFLMWPGFFGPQVHQGLHHELLWASFRVICGFASSRKVGACWKSSFDRRRLETASGHFPPRILA